MNNASKSVGDILHSKESAPTLVSPGDTIATIGPKGEKKYHNYNNWNGGGNGNDSNRFIIHFYDKIIGENEMQREAVINGLVKVTWKTADKKSRKKHVWICKYRNVHNWLHMHC